MKETIRDDDMRSKISILDCTLRDGAYIVDGKFGTTAIKGIIDKLQDAKIDIIECGWLKNEKHIIGSSYYNTPKDLEQYMTNKKKNITYTVMIDWDRYDLSSLSEYDGESIDAIRVVFPYEKYKEGIAVGKKIKDKGYRVFLQAANTLAYSDEDLECLAREVNLVGVESLSVVDTFGAMFEEDLERIVRVLHKSLDPDIKLGFHSHNNQQLSFALSMHFVEMLKNKGRECIVDSSLCGMGRGAGNTTTELIVSYLNRKCGFHYDIDAIMDAIDIYMEYFKENYSWGYSTPYFIAGMYGTHVNNIAYLIKNHRTCAKDMRNIIESMTLQERKKYNYDLLEEKYVKNMSYYVDDEKAISILSQVFLNKNILLVAPGKSSNEEKEKIIKYANDNDAVVIGVNAILPDYYYDYLFFINPARYEYAKEAFPEQFKNTKHIISSSIKNNEDEGEFIISFNRVIKRGWEHYDNAMICALRFIECFQTKKIAIAGFDGFKTKYNESYADEFLPTLNPENKWDELNEEIKSMYQDFKENAVMCRQIEFITNSIFDV